MLCDNSMCAPELPYEYMAFVFVNIPLLISFDTAINAIMHNKGYNSGHHYISWTKTFVHLYLKIEELCKENVLKQSCSVSSIK